VPEPVQLADDFIANRNHRNTFKKSPVKIVVELNVDVAQIKSQSATQARKHDSRLFAKMAVWPAVEGDQPRATCVIGAIAEFTAVLTPRGLVHLEPVPDG